jgi:hypothetical protein
MSRKVEFIPDGKRVFVSPQEVADAWLLRATGIPAQYAVGTAQHETDFTVNERDTEPSGFVSIGVFQLSQDECNEAGMPHADLLTLEDSCAVLAMIAGKRLSAILKAASLSAPVPDCWFYLALAHNEGLGACLKTLAAHGMNAAAWTARNPQLAQAAAYFNDCVTGGARWGEVALH